MACNLMTVTSWLSLHSHCHPWSCTDSLANSKMRCAALTGQTPADMPASCRLPNIMDGITDKLGTASTLAERWGCMCCCFYCSPYSMIRLQCSFTQHLHRFSMPREFSSKQANWCAFDVHILPQQKVLVGGGTSVTCIVCGGIEEESFKVDPRLHD